MPQPSRQPAAAASLRFYTEAPADIAAAFHNRTGLLKAPVLGSRFGLWRVRFDGDTQDAELPIASLKPGARPVTTVGGVLQADAIAMAQRTTGRPEVVLVDRADRRAERGARSAVIAEAVRSVETEKGRWVLKIELDTVGDRRRPTVRMPSAEAMQRAMLRDGTVPATDGCQVEVDGGCTHGHVSWMTYLGWL